MKRFGNYCRLHSSRLENNGIEVTIEKGKEFLPKLTGEMSEDQLSENVQMPEDQLSENVQMSEDQLSENVEMSEDQLSENVQQSLHYINTF